jgi:hypothetical protein
VTLVARSVNGRPAPPQSGSRHVKHRRS